MNTRVPVFGSPYDRNQKMSFFFIFLFLHQLSPDTSLIVAGKVKSIPGVDVFSPPQLHRSGYPSVLLGCFAVCDLVYSRDPLNCDPFD